MMFIFHSIIVAVVVVGVAVTVHTKTFRSGGKIEQSRNMVCKQSNLYTACKAKEKALAKLVSISFKSMKLQRASNCI